KRRLSSWLKHFPFDSDLGLLRSRVHQEQAGVPAVPGRGGRDHEDTAWSHRKAHRNSPRKNVALNRPRGCAQVIDIESSPGGQGACPDQLARQQVAVPIEAEGVGWA